MSLDKIKKEDISEEELSSMPASDRLNLAETIGHFIGNSFRPVKEDFKVAEVIAKHLTSDSLKEVRKALVEEIKSCEFLSEDIALKIAHDIEEVSSPFLKETKALKDEALEALVIESQESARTAIASRENLSENLSFAISVHGGEQSVQALMENETAEISERVCGKTIERFPEQKGIMNSMAKREDLPLTILDRLIEKLTDDVRDTLVKSYGLGEEYASYIAGQTQYKARFAILEKASEKEIEKFFRHLKTDHLLDDQTCIQVLSNTGIQAFLIAMSVRSGFGIFKVKRYLEDGTREGIAALFKEAKVSSGLTGVMYKTYLRVRKNAK